MLKKLIAIKNVGAFSAYGATGDVTFRPFTAVWGPNGVGKSTLCDVLRSFSTGDPAPLLGRRSLTGTGAPEVEILFGDGRRSFRNGAWDASSRPQFHIFDSCYVYENVHVGDFVEHDQRRNLYRVIVGEEGVLLAAAVDALDESHREATKDAGVKREAIRAQLPLGLDVDRYLGLQVDPDIQVKIQAKEKEVVALQQAEAIAKRASLSIVTLPPLPSDIDELLGTTIDGISAATERLVREHTEHVKVREAWISEGLRAVRDDQCPFCGQGVGTNALLQAFRGYFSESYGTLKEKISARLREVSTRFGEAVTQGLRAAVSRNAEIANEWTVLTGESWERTLSFDAVDAAREAILAALHRKEAAPLEPVDAILNSPAVAAFEAIAEDMAQYNAAVTSFNASVDTVRGKTKAAKLDQTQKELALLQAQRSRFEPAADEACAELRVAVSLRDEIEQQKIDAKQRLDDHAATILADYQEAINSFLQKFGANFRIMRLERRYAGGTPSSSYVLQINNAHVELGDRKTSRAEPSFRNTLSAGDRSALALAFFLAQVDRDPVLAQKVIVFDDPFTSQDRARRLCTQQEIRRIRSKAAQVIVFSHDDAFLSDCCEEVAAGDLKTLQLRRLMTGPTIDEWDASAPRSQALQDHLRLNEFLAVGEGDPVAMRSIAGKIRVVLEAYLRGRFMGKFTDTMWLGDMIGILRANEANLPEGSALPDELGLINEYSRRYHHSNPNADNEPIDETELRTWVERTLAIADGF